MRRPRKNCCIGLLSVGIEECNLGREPEPRNSQFYPAIARSPGALGHRVHDFLRVPPYREKISASDGDIDGNHLGSILGRRGGMSEGNFRHQAELW